MANEISVTGTLSCTQSGVTVSGSSTFNITLAGTAKYADTQVIPTTVEQLVFSTDAIAEGVTYVWIKNLGPTNYVELGNAALAVIYAKLLVNQVALIPVNKAAASDPGIYARSNTASCSLQIVAVGT
jgi:hypothetical protein